MQVYFQVSSITAAMRGKNVLDRNGIKSYIARAVHDDGKNGCGYSLMVNDNADRAEQLLRSSGIRIRGIHKGDGRL